jgi:hypothetical protein
MWVKQIGLSGSEIKAGLVLHLDPDVLEVKGGTFTCKPVSRVQDGHFFVCLSTSDGEATTWLPLFSNPGDGREALALTGRTGYPKWTRGTFYWHHDQVWAAPHEAVIAAAKAGGDMSRAGARNFLRTLPSIQSDSNSETTPRQGYVAESPRGC